VSCSEASESSSDSSDTGDDDSDSGDTEEEMDTERMKLLYGGAQVILI
jgi:hypothetical protein